MKMIKTAAFAAALLTAGFASAQSADMTNMFKIGANGGVSTGGNSAGNLGVDVSYQHLVTPGFGLGIATGYNHFFGKDAKFTTPVTGSKIKNNDFGVVPVAALVRVYPQKTGFYAGADLGYGFIVGDKNVTDSNLPGYNAERPNGGFYLRPELGWHNRDWNVYAHYTKVFTGDKGKIQDQNYNAGTVGVGFGYNIPLGK